MFIQNQIAFLPNHKNVILEQINNADELLLVVAYVRENGVQEIIDFIKGKKIKLLCSFDMGITQIEGIKTLIKNNVEIKVYKSNSGTFHPKIWLFGKNNQWNALIGSANMTRAALIDNVEASVLLKKEVHQETIQNALIFFQYLWDNNPNSISISLDEITYIENKVKKVNKINSKLLTIDNIDKELVKPLLEYAKQWIDIDKNERISEEVGNLWRGWYIIPDQGYINDDEINHLTTILKFIAENNSNLIINQSNSTYKNLLDFIERNKIYHRQVLKTTPHQRFVRHEKNYFLNLEWIFHPINKKGKVDKKRIMLSSVGSEISKCQKIECIKEIYSEYFNSYTFNGLKIVEYLKDIIKVTEYITLDEMNYFVIHSYSNENKSLIINLIKTYRKLNNVDTFKIQFKEYFNKVKEPTGKGVYVNYIKKIKHTLSAIAWHKDFILNFDTFELKLNENQQHIQ